MGSNFWGRLREHLSCITENTEPLPENGNILQENKEIYQRGKKILKRASIQTDVEKSDYYKFRNKVTELILEHPEDNFDLSVSCWIQDEQSSDLQRKYQQWKYSKEGQESSKELQIHKLFDLWRAGEASNANINTFIERIKSKTGTKDIIEKLQKNFCSDNEGKWKNDESENCLVYAITGAINDYCIDKDVVVDYCWLL